eukprot:scaffold862_cov216-Pinguiococcus_pyrenoidosus.AAC.3
MAESSSTPGRKTEIGPFAEEKRPLEGRKSAVLGPNASKQPICGHSHRRYNSVEKEQQCRTRTRHASSAFVQHPEADSLKLLLALSLHAFFEGLGLAGMALQQVSTGGKRGSEKERRKYRR